MQRQRTDEFVAVLDEVVRIARDERVDCLLLSGDVYEHKVASPEADCNGAVYCFVDMRVSRNTHPLVRVPEQSYGSLREMSRESGRPMSELVADAIEQLRRQRFIAEANAEYRRAGPDPEQATWDGTLADGLEGGPRKWLTERPIAGRSGRSTSSRSAGTSKAASGRPSSSPRTPSTRVPRRSSSSAR